MKANIPDELERAIYEFIYQRMLVEVLNNKLNNEDQYGNSYEVLVDRYKKAHKKMVDQKAYLKENKVRVDPMEKADELFNTVKYFVSMDPGYKEGEFRFWIAALKMELKKRFELLISGI